MPIRASPSVCGMLRPVTGAWAAAALLPLPALALIDPARSADPAGLYLGVSNAWLAAEFRRTWGPPESARTWRAGAVATAVAALADAALFAGFGLAAGVETHFPFPLMAVLSVLPAVGITPWLARRAPRHPHAAVVLTALAVGACKLAGCVAARVAYGPDALAQGYMAADWRTAKLMIATFWALGTSLSLGLLVAEYCHFARRDAADAAGAGGSACGAA